MYGLVGGVTMRYNKMRNTGNFFLEPFPDINPAYATVVSETSETYHS